MNFGTKMNGKLPTAHYDVTTLILSNSSVTTWFLLSSSQCFAKVSRYFQPDKVRSLKQQVQTRSDKMKLVLFIFVLFSLGAVNAQFFAGLRNLFGGGGSRPSSNSVNTGSSSSSSSSSSGSGSGGFGGFGGFDFGNPLGGLFGGGGRFTDDGTQEPVSTGKDEINPSDCGRDTQKGTGKLCFPDGQLCADRKFIFVFRLHHKSLLCRLEIKSTNKIQVRQIEKAIKKI